MNNKQTMSNYKTNKLMKGVSDTVYLAFVGVVSIGGAYYIYNDIATKQPTTQDTIVAEKVVDKADEPQVLAVEIKKTKTVIIETKDPITHVPVIEAISQKSVTEITPAENNMVNIETTKTPVVTTTIAIEKPTEPEATTDKSPETTSETVAIEPSEEKEASVAKEVVAATQEVKQAITSSEQDFNAMNNPHGFMHPAAMPPMPMPDRVQPQYNDAMQQAAQYMPPEYRQYAPTYNNNPIQNNRNNQGYSDQGYRENQQQNYNSQAPQNWQDPQMQQRQRGQYNNMNQNYAPENYAPENYAPWNPGRFY